MYGFGGVGLSEVQISISELSVVGSGWWWWWVGGRDKRTSWSDLVGVRQKTIKLFVNFTLWPDLIAFSDKSAEEEFRLPVGKNVSEILYSI